MIKKMPMIILASTIATIAVAADDFSQIDTDRDGAITRAEATAEPELYNNWTETDANEDGVVDQAEFAKFEAMPSQPEGSTE